MARGFVVNGPTMVYVKGRVGSAIQVLTELGLTQDPIQVTLDYRHKDIKVDASICKVYATEIAGKVVDRCIQMFGGLGVAREMPLERWHREMRIKRIGEGPSEVHRMVVARDLLGGQRKKA